MDKARRQIPVDLLLERDSQHPHMESTGLLAVHAARWTGKGVTDHA